MRRGQEKRQVEEGSREPRGPVIPLEPHLIQGALEPETFTGASPAGR
jgi:hypothetical protein